MTSLDDAFAAHRRLVWGIGYRMLGSAADADDLVQDSFAQAIERPPSGELRPWLVAVAMNLARDKLRRRRRSPYVGPWLPSPIETGDASCDEPASYEAILGSQSTEGRYDLLESVSYAFLLALEALTPAQRAVLLLREVFDYSVAETAAALGLGQANVKTTLHRARRAMAAYDATRTRPTRELQERSRRALDEFLASLLAQDARRAERMLARSVRELSDGGGEFRAALKPIVGPERVVRLFLSLTAEIFSGDPPPRAEIRMLNGLPALLVERAGGPFDAPRMVVRADLDAAGRIREVYSVLASHKLDAVRPIGVL